MTSRINVGDQAADEERPKLFRRVSQSQPNLNVLSDFDPFDPELRMNAPGSITVLEAFIHLLKGSLGTGVLAMAHAFSYVGTLLGFAGTLVLIFLLGHCVHLLMRAQYFQCKRLGMTYIEYPDSMEEAFKKGPPFCRKLAPAMPYLVDFFMLFYQLGACSCYFIFMAYSIEQVATMNGLHLPARVWMCLLLIPIMLLNLIRDLHYLAPVSSAGNIAFCLAMVVIYYYMFGYDRAAYNYFSERPAIVWPPNNWPLFIGTACFCVESIAIMVKIEHHMKKPKMFRAPLGVFNVATFITSLLFAFTGLFGYLKYGDEAKGSITLNIASDQILAQIVKLLYGLVIFFSFPLQSFVPLELLWVNYIRHHMTSYSEKKKLYVEIVFREVIVILTFAFAMVIPHLDLLIALFGAFCLASLAIIFPVIINTLVLQHEEITFGPYNWMLYKNYLLIAFGLFFMVSGTIISVKDIVAAIVEDLSNT